MADALEFLSEVTAIIEGKHKVLLSLEEIELAIDLQARKVAELTSLKDKQAVYAMVMLDCFKFLKSGKADDPEQFDDSNTEGQLKQQVCRVAAGIYKDYVNNLPIKYLVPPHEASTRELLVMQKALAENQDAMMELGLLMKSIGNAMAYEYWLKKASEEIIYSAPIDGVAPVGKVAPRIDIPASQIIDKNEKNLVSDQYSKRDLPKAPEKVPQFDGKKQGTEYALQSRIIVLPPLVLKLFSIEDGVIRQKHAINFVKLSVFPVCMAFSLLYAKFDTTFLVYFACHSAYSVSWFIATSMFSLNSLERTLTDTEVYETILCLNSFFIPPFLICSYNVQLTNIFLAFLSFTAFIGNFVVTGSIIQKSCMQDQLPKTGFFKHVRNPTVFGEILVYFSLASMSFSILGFLPLCSFFLFVWVPSIKFKEEGLAAKYTQQWVSYRKSTKCIIPFAC